MILSKSIQKQIRRLLCMRSYDRKGDALLRCIFHWLMAMLLVSTSASALEQTNHIANSVPPLRGDVLSTWTTDQGLPQNFITSLAQTPDGFLWVGTLTGLVRFDGLSFRNFNKDGPPEMQDRISALVGDNAGGLWIAAHGGLFHYRSGHFTHISFQGNMHYEIDALAPSRRDGGLWVYWDGKLARTIGDRLEIEALPLPAVKTPSDMEETLDGTLWITDGENIFAISPSSGGMRRFHLQGAQMLYADRFGDMFAGDRHHLFRFDGQKFQQVKNPGLTNFVSVMMDSHRRLWMASGGLHGLTRKSGDTIENLTVADGLASNDARTLLEDRNGDIWIGTISGLQRLHHGIFTTYAPQAVAADHSAQPDAIFEQKNGAIWVGTVEDGVLRFKDGRWRRFGTAEGLSRGQARGCFEDGDMPAIAISDYGIFEWNGKHFVKIPSIPHGYIDTPVTAGDGSVWLNVLQKGLFVMRHRQVQPVGAMQGLSSSPVWSVGADPQGAPWVGTATALQRWDGQRFQNVLTSPAPVLTVAWLPGRMAIGTLHGLILRRDGGAMRTLTQDDGLPGNTVLDVIADGQENLWIATTRAITLLRRSQWMDYMEGRSNRIEPAIFTKDDGLKGSNVLPLNIVTAMRTADGRIWFATSNGVSAVDPHLSPEPVARAAMDAVIVDEQQRPVADLSVAPGRHRITFRYTSPATIAPEQTRFRYRLLGWDEHWVDAGTAREVSYTGLTPGSYTFQVTAANRESAGDPQPASLHMSLRPFFWQTKWFLAAVIVFVAAVIVEVTRRRTRVLAERLSLRFQERVAERERIAYQIHDTVIQDLIGATLKLELLGFQIADQPETAGHSIEALAGKMRKIIERSRNMLSNLHATAVIQYDLAEVLRHAEAEFRQSDIPGFKLTSEGEARPVHPLVRDEVYRICRETLANAFRHSNAQHVAVCVRFLPHLLEVEITDDGEGMSEETRVHGRPGHFGLRGMQAHAQRIGAKLDIVSSPGSGTTVTLRVATEQWKKWQPWRHDGAGTGHEKEKSLGNEGRSA
jgi:signal transduction histidine kinase/ligand-binding sensor domain-containing protein